MAVPLRPPRLLRVARTHHSTALSRLAGARRKLHRNRYVGNLLLRRATGMARTNGCIWWNCRSSLSQGSWKSNILQSHYKSIMSQSLYKGGPEGGLRRGRKPPLPVAEEGGWRPNEATSAGNCQVFCATMPNCRIGKPPGDGEKSTCTGAAALHILTFMFPKIG